MSSPGLTEGQKDLVAAARVAAARAYVPYSRFPVGAAVLGGSGRVHVGCNVENSSYPVGLCAERNAMGTAVAEGETQVLAIAVASAEDRVATLTPCGMCRQFLAEFGAELLVIFPVDGAWQATPIRELLPSAFSLETG